MTSIRTRIRALEAEIRALRLEAFDRLVRVIMMTVAGRAFSAKEVWAHACLVSPELQEALEAAAVASPRQLGKMFQRLQGCDIGGLRLERLGDDHEGAIWAFRVCPALSGEPLPII